MNTQELINKIEQLPSNLIDKKVVISKDSVVELVKQLDERPKVKVSQVAVDYYSQYKDKLSGFDEWFCDLYDDDFESNFARAEDLRIWLYDNDNKTNYQRELALATLIVNGLDAVEVEQEKEYTVRISANKQLLSHGFSGYLFGNTGLCRNKLTKTELEQAGFGWVFDCEGVEVQEVE